MADYQADMMQVRKYRYLFNKYMMDHKILAFTPIYVGDNIQAYSGNFSINIPQHQIDVQYYGPQTRENPIKAPDKVNLGGLDFIVNYTEAERGKISSAEDIEDMRKRSRKKK